MKNPRPAEERFWRKVDWSSEDGCWEWQACLDSSGYGSFGKGKAHRFSYEINVGPIPPGILVCHHCDNPACVRPDHLFLGTKKDNNDDCARKGRRRRAQGEANGGAKLTWEKVRLIRSDKFAHIPREQIAALFGIGKTASREIRHFRAWKNDPLLAAERAATPSTETQHD